MKIKALDDVDVELSFSVANKVFGYGFYRDEKSRHAVMFCRGFRYDVEFQLFIENDECSEIHFVFSSLSSVPHFLYVIRRSIDRYFFGAALENS